ncbi:MAG: hypothetical protein K1X66_02980 [Verrucomicrobiae bacterium]|nr:hypothetical protein [Verrucomicrobiae bacterium]
MKILETLLLAFFGIPIIGLLFGGIYSLPAIYLTKEKEPWFSLLLSFGLAMTVFGIGFLGQVPLLYLVCVWLFTIICLFIARKIFGGLGHNLERFGMVHSLALLLIFLVITLCHFGVLGK